MESGNPYVKRILEWADRARDRASFARETHDAGFDAAIINPAGYTTGHPALMAATVAAPLERRLAGISGVTEITSTSSLGSTNITIQFDLSRNIDGAARDVQAALNAALTDLPGDLPSLPSFRKANPAAAPILILALTAKNTPASAIYDAADSIIAQRIAQIEGVSDVTVNGSEQPAIRIDAYGLGKLEGMAAQASPGKSLSDLTAGYYNARRNAADKSHSAAMTALTGETPLTPRGALPRYFA